MRMPFVRWMGACGRRAFGRSSTHRRGIGGSPSGIDAKLPEQERTPMKGHDSDAGSPAPRGRRVSRRTALKTLGAAGLIVPAAPYVIRQAFAADQPMGPGGIPLARP